MNKFYLFILADHCAGINCHYGTCYEGRCSCSEGYTGTYCENLSMKITFFVFEIKNIFFKILVTIVPPSPPPPPVPQVAQTPPRPLLTPQTVGLLGPKKGQLIDYGRLLGARAGPIGGLLALISGLLLLPLALAFAARKCAHGACIPAGGRYIPVLSGATAAAQTEQRMLFIE